MPKVSVIMPVYNTEKYLEKCLQSLVSQTLEDIELILVDNGANQACKNILAKYENHHSNIKIIHLEKNVGYGTGMNAGLEASSGNYIGFCDSDDWVESDFYERLWSTANKQKSEIAYAEYIQEYPDHTISMRHRENVSKVSGLADKLDIIKNGAVWDKIFKRELVVSHNIRFSTSPKSYYEDNIFLFQAVYFANAISLVFNTNYHYVWHENSTLNNIMDCKERNAHKLNVIAHLINYALKQKFSSSDKIACIKFLNRSLGLSGVLKREDGLEHLLNKINKDQDFTGFLYKIHSAYHPSFFHKVFSIQNDFQKKNLWICGLKIKFKNKENKI